jgi:hypothetical protein
MQIFSNITTCMTYRFIRGSTYTLNQKKFLLKISVTFIYFLKSVTTVAGESVLLEPQINREHTLCFILIATAKRRVNGFGRG